MALIQCVDCGNNLSTDAVACQVCGKPAPPKPVLKKDLGAGGWLFLAGIVMILVWNPLGVGYFLALIGFILLVVRLAS